MPERFAGKVVIVTGATSGIGRATALEFATEGAKVVVAGRRARAGDAVVSEIAARGGEAHFIQTDVRDPEAIARMVNETVRRYGRLDCAFNNAGIGGSNARTAEHTPDVWNDVLSTNIMGVCLCMKYEIPRILESGGGSIVNSGSVFGLRGSGYGIAPYVASKHAVVGVTRAAAVEYGGRGVRINAVCPGMTDTAMCAGALQQDADGFLAEIARIVPMGRMATPREIACGVLWLCSEESSYVTGQTLCADGGWTAR
jgi:NAD(P)-dependent dehydrogenase (short-subunit alcohol dehydrogenase family)